MPANNDWNAFVSQFHGGDTGNGRTAPTFADPFANTHARSFNEFGGVGFMQPGYGLTNARFGPGSSGSNYTQWLSRQQNVLGGNTNNNDGWAKLWASGLMDPYTDGKGMYSAYNPKYASEQAYGDYMSGNQAALAIQNAFRDWQTSNAQQAQQPQTPPDPTPLAVDPSAAQVLEAFAQSAPVNAPMPLGTYASLLAAMNTPQPVQATQTNPLASWIFQYLRG